ncbi:MAG: ATP-binding cassette domain-containing protein, partial [Candidatus Riflebacteria bacterium]|nr:ATP-binding cassette domain-containing protein [Candidatus Riflebacteria bacterium]
NPATYTGLFDQVRELFARLPGARAAGLTRGHFSFNVELGRCETCEGAGVREVGLHFLGTVESRCERCGGRRFASEVLAVTHDGLNVGEVLELTVEEALRFFQGHRKIERFLRAMDRLGLGYLPLGQPSTTLSGGEAQRLKLAAELARPATGRTLYLLDEPASGLHPADVNALIAALGHLVARGNTVIASEHAPEVIRVADRIVDLGPESGDEGGEIVVTGSPAEVMACRRSWTGRALLDAAMAPSGVDAPGRSDRAAEPPIRLEGVTTHNLKRIDVSIPSNALTVITGVSGSGKSSLAFDTLFAEGQQRFVDCFPTHARRLFTRVGEAELEAAQGLRPAIAIAQVRAATNPRSTVGTVTGVFDDYRLLFSRVGVVHCPVCGSPPSGTGCRRCGGEPRPRPSAADLSPNTDQGACRRCKGLGFETRCVPGRLVSDPSRSLLDGAMAGHRAGRYYGEPHGQHMAILRAVGEAHGIDFSRPYADLEAPARRLAMEGAADRVYDVVWSYRRGRRAGDHRFTSTWKGLLGYVDDEYRRKHSDRRGDALLPLMEEAPCPDCAGARLGPAALAVRFSGLNIAELSSRTADESLAFFRALGHREGWRAAAVDELAADLEVRLERLVDAGLGYLSVDRRTDSLSAGEFQRLRLASQIGRGLTGVVYVLDEPTVGLHPRDTARLIRLLDDLKRAGNTVVVVEHDVDVIRSADHVIDVGPGAGDAGGRIVAQGTIAEIRGAPESSTGRWLRRVEAVGPWSRRALEPGLTVRGATVHNLRGLDVEIPSGGIVAVTGVSGSGKSTLVFDVIAATLAAPAAPGAPGAGQARTHPAPVGCRELVTHAPFDAVVRVTSGARGWESATPATAMGASEPIRELFARTPSAVARGLTRAAFSTQVRGGRCESCEGQGQVRVPMDFLPDVWIRCEECGGRRFVADVLACSWEGRTMAEVLEMTVHEAAGLFASHRTIVVPLALLSQAGLGYLRLGQRTSTLSGGELQRLALARELVTARGSRRLYILDEPTTGLHLDDVDRLLGVLRGLVADGHTVLVVEHNLEVIAGADWVIDLGPEGGAGGGRLVVAGTPEQVAAAAGSHTGRFLERRLSGPL